MSGMYGISAYQQTNSSWKAGKTEAGGVKAGAVRGDGREAVSKNGSVRKPEYKEWTPLDSNGPLVPRTTEYGSTIGDVRLSDKAKDYYDKLKSKFHNMEFIAVSSDMKAKVQQNAAAYGNSSKMVVLIDDEKLERMAADESYRKKYEGIIAMSQARLQEAKNSLSSSGAAVKNFGMSVDSNGNESFFATVGKSQDLQKKRMEKKAAEKKEQKLKEKKQAEKKEREERIRKAGDKKAEKAEKEDDPQEDTVRKQENQEYISIEASSMEELLSRVSAYSYNNASEKVMTDMERTVGAHVDFKW